MFGIDKISVSLNYGIIPFIFGLIILTGFTFYTYHFTIPTISKSLKYLLLFLRTFIIVIVLFLIFEPLLRITLKKEISPVNFIFVDNSSSMVAFDSASTVNNITGFANNLLSNLKGETKLFSFGSNLKSSNTDNLKFDEQITNINSVIDFIKTSENNISSIIVISDGIITDGINPINSINKLNAPIFTVPIGDTSSNIDANISKININEYLYTKSPTTIGTVINNSGLKDKKVKIGFYEDNRLITSQEINLSKNGIDKVNFIYTPTSSGEKKLSFSISNLKEDKNLENNKYIHFAKVLDSKVKIAIISSSPSSDVSFVLSSLKLNLDYDVKLVQQVGKEFLGNVNPNKAIDSADVLVLIGFPTIITPSDLANKVNSEIDKGKPHFFVLSNDINFQKLKMFEKNLPFMFKSESNSKILVQPYVTDENSALLKNNSSNFLDEWNNLPPTYRTSTELITKPESNTLLKTKIQNVPTQAPLLVTGTIGKKRSIAVLCQDIWKWKLQNSNKNSLLFDQFLSSSIKWLNVMAEQKQLNVKTTKRIYAKGETIEFSGSAYDETFNPIDNAEIKITAKNNNDKYDLIMESIGNGLYKADFVANKAGSYSFEANGIYKAKTLGINNGKFSVGEINIEKINLKQNTDLLQSYASLSGGKMIELDNIDLLIDEANKRFLKTQKFVFSTKELKLWSIEYILGLIIFLFAIEWFLRKRAGLL